jgi:hypothetical protein
MNSGQDPCGNLGAISSADHSILASSLRSSSPLNVSVGDAPSRERRPPPPAPWSPAANWRSHPRSNAPRWPSGANTISTRLPDRRAVATETSAGRSVMLTSRSPFRGSRHAGHGQLTRSQIAGSPNGPRSAPAGGSLALTGYPGRSGGLSALPVTSLRQLSPYRPPRAVARRGVLIYLSLRWDG